ncbi:50S ribosomal protein L19 [Chloroflexota bacterium]
MNMESVVSVKENPNIPEITSGDTVKVSTRVVEGDKERTQVFQGVVIKIRRRGVSSSFTVRRVTYGVGVERTFPFYSPRVEKVEIMRRGKKRRAKLYYLRGLSAKTSRLQERRMTDKEIKREQERLDKLEQEKQASKQDLEAEMEEEIVELEQAEAAVPVEESGYENEVDELPDVEEAPVTEEEEIPVAEAEEAPVAEEEEAPVSEEEETPEAVEEEAPVAEEEETPVMEQEPEPEEEKQE